MTRTDFDSVLDRCLDDMRSGRRSIESCLDEWPQFADRLGPALRTAAALHSRTAAAPDAARRAELMATLATTPQERAPRSRPLFPRLTLPRSRIALAAPAAAIAAALLVLVLLRPFGAPPVAEAATLTTFGDVERAQDGQWLPASDNDSVSGGGRLRTAADASAVLTFEDGTTITLDPSTEVVLERNDRGGRRLEVRQLNGRVWSNVITDEGGSYRLDTAHATVLVSKTTAFETAVDDHETIVNAVQGDIEVQADGDRALPAPGEVIRARVGERLTRAAAEPSSRVVTIRVDGAFAASLISPRGLATGARPDGVLYRQIPGTLTTGPTGGDQRIALLAPVEGVYTLLLRRFDHGEASAGGIVIMAAGFERRIEVPSTAEAMSIRLRVSVGQGTVAVEVESAAPIAIERIDRLERIVLAPGIRKRAVEALRDRRRQFAAPSQTVLPR